MPSLWDIHIQLNILTAWKVASIPMVLVFSQLHVSKDSFCRARVKSKWSPSISIIVLNIWPGGHFCLHYNTPILGQIGEISGKSQGLCTKI